jgi:hypothetical protein
MMNYNPYKLWLCLFYSMCGAVMAMIIVLLSSCSFEAGTFDMNRDCKAELAKCEFDAMFETKYHMFWECLGTCTESFVVCTHENGDDCSACDDTSLPFYCRDLCEGAVW